MTDTLSIVSLAEMRAHVRLTSDETDYDDDLTSMLEAARGYVEGWCGPLDDFADSIPPAITHAMKMYAAHLFENREAAQSEGRVSEVPMGFFDLIDPHRLRAF
ncbi:head-tail connector protein [Xanthobacter autotrophicus DSM 431]|uniref:head-tail connector protein n=1 Tax=Xanthobacter nonsaccharivorans TaxID=3119912 RepID=UPI0037292FE6